MFDKYIPTSYDDLLKDDTLGTRCRDIIKKYKNPKFSIVSCLVQTRWDDVDEFGPMVYYYDLQIIYFDISITDNISKTTSAYDLKERSFDNPEIGAINARNCYVDDWAADSYQNNWHTNPETLESHQFELLETRDLVYKLDKSETSYMSRNNPCYLGGSEDLEDSEDDQVDVK